MLQHILCFFIAWLFSNQRTLETLKSR